MQLKCYMMSVVLSQLFLEGIRDFPKANSIVKRNEHSLHQNKWDKVLKAQKPPKMRWPKTHIGYNKQNSLTVLLCDFQSPFSDKNTWPGKKSESLNISNQLAKV